MIIRCTGDIFDSSCDALVNPVNCIGVMGAGLAKEFKVRFPENYTFYREMCRSAKLTLGNVLTSYSKGKFIINFPTKYHFKDVSKLSFIRSGMISLVEEIHRLGLSSVAIPAIGAGLGRLKYDAVEKTIVDVIKSQDNGRVTYCLFQPIHR